MENGKRGMINDVFSIIIPILILPIIISFPGYKHQFAKKLKKQITIRIGVDTLGYFKDLSEETGIPYQNLIDSYLSDCAYNHRKLQMKWM